MSVKQGNLELLQHPASKELLESTIPARLAYVWTDGSPRVVPIWFHWNGREFVLGTPSKAPKVKALAKNPKVALTIDDNTFPHKVVLVRGTARLETLKGIVPESAVAAERYFGSEQGKAWVTQLGSMIQEMVRITITPEWVGLLDFQVRFPSALPRGAFAPKLPHSFLTRFLLMSLPAFHQLRICESAKLCHAARKREARLRWRRHRAGQRRNRNSRLSQVESGHQVPHIARCIARGKWWQS